MYTRQTQHFSGRTDPSLVTHSSLIDVNPTVVVDTRVFKSLELPPAGT